MRRYQPPVEPDQLQWFSPSNAVAAGFGLLTGAAMVAGLFWAGARGDAPTVGPPTTAAALASSAVPAPVPPDAGVETLKAALARSEARELLLEQSLARPVRFGSPPEATTTAEDGWWEHALANEAIAAVQVESPRLVLAARPRARPVRFGAPPEPVPLTPETGAGLALASRGPYSP